MDQSTSANCECCPNNWTSYVYQRQIFGSKIPRKIFKKRQPERRREPLRTYRLSKMIPRPMDLEHVFLGFSLDGNYLYSYLEVSDADYESMVGSMRSYVFGIWRFIPGKQLRLIYLAKLFDGETFLESLCIRVEQRAELPNVCVVIGNMTGSDCNTLTQTLWHSILILPPWPDRTRTFQINFHALYALSSDLRLNDGYLVISTGDELILLNLKQTRVLIESFGSSSLVVSVGDISENKLRDAHHFSYANQTLKWCLEDCSARLHSTCVGLIDYHLFIETLSDDSCEGGIFALFDVDVDTNERCYYESMFTFRWDLRTNAVERLSSKLLNVSDRSKEPGKQQKAFSELRKGLFVECSSGIVQRRTPPLYELSNLSVLEGYSLQRILDATSLVALTL